MKFSKYNNPNKRSVKARSPFSESYISERRAELEEMLAKTDDPKKKEALRMAYEISINP